MPNYNSTHTGAEIDESVTSYLNDKNSGGTVNQNSLNTTLNNYVQQSTFTTFRDTINSTIEQLRVDYVVDQGQATSSDGSSWTYIKYASGLVKMWGYKHITGHAQYATFSFGGNCYGYAHYYDMYYPFTLTDLIAVIPYTTVASAFTIPTIIDGEITVNKARVYGLGIYGGAQSATTRDFYARCQVIGKWK